MPFTEQKASIRYEMINGSRTPVLTPETEVQEEQKEDDDFPQSLEEALLGE